MPEPDPPAALLGCPDCDAPSLWTVGQRATSGRLCWWRSLRCDDCGAAIEADDAGAPPESIRRYLLERDGAWRVRLSPPVERVAAMKALRCLLGLQLAEAAKRVRAGVASTGTRAEAEWVARALDGAAVACVVEPGERSEAFTVAGLAPG